MTTPSGLARGRFLAPCPTNMDLAELTRLERVGHTELVFEGEDQSNRFESFDAVAFIQQTVEKYRGTPIDGVLIGHDYPAAMVSAIIADQLGLPGPDPRAIMLCQNKFAMRALQQNIMPDFSAPAWLYDSTWQTDRTDGLLFPLFAKPVRAWLSMFAAQVANVQELEQLYQQAKPYLAASVKPFNAMAELYQQPHISPDAMLLEGLLEGTQVTIEGYMWQNNARILAITDSVMYPGTISFSRFDLPSALPSGVQERMSQIVTTLMEATAFGHGLFNVELFYDESRDKISIIEVNPRLVYQFADLLEKVLGVNTYEIALELAAGREPQLYPHATKITHATSFVLRAFHKQRIESVPSAADIEAFYAAFPDARLHILCTAGTDLAAQRQDLGSFRYAIINLGGTSKANLEEHYKRACDLLPFEFSA